jgi:hypothetical protein
MPVIPATQEAEVGRAPLEASPGKSERSYLKNKLGVEWASDHLPRHDSEVDRRLPQDEGHQKTWGSVSSVERKEPQRCAQGKNHLPRTKMKCVFKSKG